MSAWALEFPPSQKSVYLDTGVFVKAMGPADET